MKIITPKFDNVLLRNVRLRRNMTQAEAAHRIGVAPETLCRYEKGKKRPRPERIRQLAKLYRIHPYKFITTVEIEK